MNKELFKIDRNKFLDTLDYIHELEKLGPWDIDYTGLIGRDLTQKEKDDYGWAYERKTTIEIINIVFNDFIEHRLNE